MDVGRPQVMTEDTIRILEKAFGNGATDLEACFLAKISKSTLYDYQKEHPEFLERKEALKDMIKYQAKRLVKDAIEKGNIEQANWYLERKAKDEGFSTRQELAGVKDQPIVVQTISYADNNNTVQLSTEELPITSSSSDGQGSEESGSSVE